MWNLTSQLSTELECNEVSESKHAIVNGASAHNSIVGNINDGGSGEEPSADFIDEINQAMKDAFALLDETEKALGSPV